MQCLTRQAKKAELLSEGKNDIELSYTYLTTYFELHELSYTYLTTYFELQRDHKFRTGVV